MVEHDYPHGGTDRMILTGMIVSRAVLGRIAAAWKPEGLFASRHLNAVAGQCVRYLAEHKQAPGRHIEAIMREWADSRCGDKDAIAGVNQILGASSSEYERQAEEINPDYVVELAQRRFDQIDKEKLADAVKNACDAGKHDKVDAIIADWRRVSMGSASGSYLSDAEAWQAAFDDKHEPLVKFGGAVGRFMADAWERDGFLTYVAPEKRGKSHHLIYAAFLAAKQRRKVAFFGAGDMSVRQYRRRFAALAAKRPLRPGPYRVPTGIEVYSDDKGCTRARPTGWKNEECADWLFWKEGHDAYLAMLRDSKLRDDPIWISCHGNSELSVAKIRSILTQREQEDGFVPDLIVIDYADILALSGSRMEPRDQHDKNWRELRALSLERHCLVVTATQSNRKGYDVDILRMDNMSEDKRKLAHATGVLGINVTAPEKESGVCRLNWIALRENEFSSRRVVHCAGCLGFSHPFIRTMMTSGAPEREDGGVADEEPSGKERRKERSEVE